MYNYKKNAFLLVEAVVALSIISAFFVIFVKFQREIVKLDKNSMIRIEALSGLVNFKECGGVEKDLGFEKELVTITPNFDLRRRLETFLEKDDIFLPKFVFNKVSVCLNEKDKNKKISLYF